jgi:segregation and condensation protein A
MSATYTIKLPQFEGPFDLLLFFIERDELDIHDIPISNITNDFLDYLRQLESLNIDLASEFILVAATLMRIKAKMLIPRKPLDDEGNEIDPREELVQRLLEYKRYKSVLEEMRTMEEDRSFRNVRGNTSEELRKIATKALVDIELESLNLFKLMKAFERILLRMEDNKKKAVHHVYSYNHTVQGQQIYLLSRVKKGVKTEFNTIFGKCENRVHAVITFLALLELLNMQKLKCILGIGFNNFWLTVPDETDELPDMVDEEEE